LPPSFGDKAIAGQGNTLLDDFAPSMARIKYGITASLQEAPCDNNVARLIAETKKVRIVPATEESAPLSTDGPESDYILRSEKDIRKGVFKGKLGRLVVETAQPRAASIPRQNSEQQGPDGTVATVNLRFDPASTNAQPPKLNSLSTKFKAMTFYASCPRTRLPSKHDMRWDMSQAVHQETTNLASRCVANVEWKFHSDSTGSRRNSTESSDYEYDSTPAASSKYKSEGFYTAQILVPISLPNDRAWIPTFHSCLVSRTYTLAMHLSLSAGAIAPGLDLRVPVQLYSEGNQANFATRRPSLSQADQAVEAMEAMEADDFFTPRTVSPMDAHLVGGSTLRAAPVAMAAEDDLPPGYEAFPRISNRVPVLV